MLNSPKASKNLEEWFIVTLGAQRISLVYAVMDFRLWEYGIADVNWRWTDIKIIVCLCSLSYFITVGIRHRKGVPTLMISKRKEDTYLTGEITAGKDIWEARRELKPFKNLSHILSNRFRFVSSTPESISACSLKTSYSFTQHSHLFLQNGTINHCLRVPAWGRP